MDMEDLDSVQQRIRYIFEQTKLTQKDFADILGIGQPHLSGVMSDRKPSKRLVLMIVEKTGVNLDWLANGTGPIYQQTGEPPCDPPELAKVISRAREVWPAIEDARQEKRVAEDMLRHLEVVTCST